MGQVTSQYDRQRLGEFAVRVVDLYTHHADLAAYATKRVNGELDLPLGTKDRVWWTGLMDECVAKRDALHLVIKWIRTGLGMKVSPRPPSWSRGLEIYIRDFLMEGSPKTFDEYIKQLGLDYTRPDELVQFCGSRSFEAPGSAGAPDVPPEAMTDEALERAHQEGEGYGTPDR